METLSVIDCAISSPSNDCLNEIIKRTKIPFTYHLPAMNGTESLKEDLDAKAYLVFGSHSSVNEELPWQNNMAQFLVEKLNQGIPVLGLCFGHQLMAKAFGGKVENASTEHKGVREWEIISKDDRWNLSKKDKFLSVVYHKEEIKELPSSFQHLGQSDRCKYDVVSHKSLPYLGTQGHPEASQYFVDKEMEMENQIPEDLVLRALNDGNVFLDSFLKAAGFFFDCSVNHFVRVHTMNPDRHSLNTQDMAH